MPDLGHVPNLVAVELHDVDVVRRHFFPRRRNRPALAAMGCMENGVRRDVAPLLVGCARAYLVSRHAVAVELHQPSPGGTSLAWIGWQGWMKRNAVTVQCALSSRYPLYRAFMRCDPAGRARAASNRL